MQKGSGYSTVIDGGHVTTTELLTELSAAKDKFDWRVNKKGYLRGHLNKDEKLTFDPITAFAYLQTGRIFPEGQWADAATAVGLSFTDCAAIVAACNYDWEPSCRQGLLRNEFLNTLARVHKVETSAAQEKKQTSAFAAFGKRLRKRTVMPAH